MYKQFFCPQNLSLSSESNLNTEDIKFQPTCSSNVKTEINNVLEDGTMGITKQYDINIPYMQVVLIFCYNSM